MTAKLRDELITLAHGSGGKATRILVEGLFLEELANPLLAQLGDSAVGEVAGMRLAFTTDSYVVKPLFFRGGDIGELAVNGTVNDLAVAGAKPLWLSAGFVLEEGFPVADLRRIAASMARAAAAAGVAVVAGDTKVVERGSADGLFVTTAGVGLVRPDTELGPGRARPGDRVLVSGTIGDHGFAVLVARGDLRLETDLESDTAPVHELTAALTELGPALRWMRDPTRGGLATALNELAQAAGLAVRLDEAALPSGPRWPERPRSSGSTRSTSRTRASSWRSSRPRRPTPHSQLFARTRWVGTPSWSASSSPSRKASSCSTRRSAAAGSSTCWSAIPCRGSADLCRGLSSPLSAPERPRELDRACSQTCHPRRRNQGVENSGWATESSCTASRARCTASTVTGCPRRRARRAC